MSLFPARLGADSAALIRMIRIGESTDWWTGTFYWFVRITSVDGRYIWLTSIVQLVLLFTSIFNFITALPIPERNKKFTLYVIATNPLYGVFGMTIAHDATQTAGILLMVSIGLKICLLSTRDEEIGKPNLFLSFLLVLTTHTGVFFILIFVIGLFILKMNHRFTSIVVASLCLLLSFVITLHVNKSLEVYGRRIPTNEYPYSVLVADIKCIVQIPGVQVSAKTWLDLEKIASRNDWLNPVTCANKDQAVNSLRIGSEPLIKYRKEIFAAFREVALAQPQIVLMAHIQRSRGALPPPFFQPPDNQVSWKTDVPIGQNAGVSLQQGPEVLHPSLDANEFKSNNVIHRLLEPIAQAPILLINQASWFFGWAGLWLWPIIMFVYKKRANFGSVARAVLVFSPLLALHAQAFLLIPYSQARYFMATILIGFMILINLFLEERIGNSDD